MTDDLATRLLDIASPLADEAAGTIYRLTAERDEAREQARMTSFAGEGYAFMEQRAQAAEADNARLRGAIEYVLDGYGLNAPDFERQPEDDEDNWIVLTLRAALNTRKEVMPSEPNGSAEGTRNIGPGDQAVAGAAQKGDSRE